MTTLISPVDELQQAIVAHCKADAQVKGVFGVRIYDRVPKRPKFPYMSFGPSDGIEDDAECITGTVQTLQLDIWSRDQGGKQEAQTGLYVLKRALHLAPITLNVHALVELRYQSDRVFPDPDGLTQHGVLVLQAIIEEN